eukprot:1196067-Prorocentrum_minimum.AAC.14
MSLLVILISLVLSPSQHATKSNNLNRLLTVALLSSLAAPQHRVSNGALWAARSRHFLGAALPEVPQQLPVPVVLLSQHLLACGDGTLGELVTHQVLPQPGKPTAQAWTGRAQRECAGQLLSLRGVGVLPEPAGADWALFGEQEPPGLGRQPVRHQPMVQRRLVAGA